MKMRNVYIDGQLVRKFEYTHFDDYMSDFISSYEKAYPEITLEIDDEQDLDVYMVTQPKFVTVHINGEPHSKVEFNEVDCMMLDFIEKYEAANPNNFAEVFEFSKHGIFISVGEK